MATMSGILETTEENIVLSPERRQALVEYAIVAMVTGRYDDMARAINFVVKNTHLLNGDEIKLFVMAFRETTDTRLCALKLIDGILQREPVGSRHQDIIKYKEQIEIKLQEICYYTLNLIDHNILLEMYGMNSKILLCKVRADCYIYLAPVIPENKQEMASRGLFAYYAVYDLCRTSLSAAHPLRLDVALTIGVFHKHNLNTPAEAIYVLKEAVQNAMNVFQETNTFLETAGLVHLMEHLAMVWEMQYREAEYRYC